MLKCIRILIKNYKVVYSSFLLAETFDFVNLSKRENKGSSLQNLYFSSNGFFVIFGWTDSMCNIEESCIETNLGQANPLSVPSIVGVLKHFDSY